jgi:predicted TIM-barrel fold metal-dependent hydrolase
VIDMHVHGTMTAPSDLARLASINVRYVFLAGLQSDLAVWSSVDPARYLPALIFPCAGGRAPITGRPCFDTTSELPDIEWLRRELRAGRIRGFGELEPQYLGMSPDDERFEPYWRVAEEFDLPVGIHMGPGPPGVAYESSRVPFKSPGFRMAAGDPLLLESVLLRHKRLRLFVMHAGWPRLDEMMALLYAHPNVYVDVAGLQSAAITPRAGYLWYLQRLVESGFARRIMFGSDFADQVESGIQTIVDAPFLSAEQEAGILCGNAVRFLRLAASVCAP